MKDIWDSLLERDRWVWALLYLFALVFLGFWGLGQFFNFQTWIWAHRITDKIYFFNWLKLVPVILMFIALVTYVRSLQRKYDDDKYRKFTTTLQAEKYFNEEVLKTLHYSEKVFKAFIDSKRGSNSSDSKVIYDESSFQPAIEKANFSLAFRKLNYLAAYTQKRMVDKELLFSNIGDDLREFVKIQDFDKISNKFNKTHRNMTDFQQFIKDNEDYLSQKEMLDKSAIENAKNVARLKAEKQAKKAEKLAKKAEKKAKKEAKKEARLNRR